MTVFNTMTPGGSYFATHQAGGIMLANSLQLHLTENLSLRFWGSQHTKKIDRHSIILVCLLSMTELIFSGAESVFSTCYTLIHSLVNSTDDYSALTTCQALFEALSNSSEPEFPPSGNLQQKSRQVMRNAPE